MIKDKEFIEKHVIVPILTPYTPYGIDSTGSTFVASFPECFAFRSLGTQVSFLQEASIFISHNASVIAACTLYLFRFCNIMKMYEAITIIRRWDAKLDRRGYVN